MSDDRAGRPARETVPCHLGNLPSVLSWMLRLTVLGMIVGCGAPAANSPQEPTEQETSQAAGENDDDNSAAEQENPIVQRLKQIEVELNREPHTHSICHEALELVEQALREDPKLAIAYAVRADVQAEHGETAAARRDYKKAFSLDRYNMSYGQKLAVCYEAEGDNEEALDVWKELCRRFPDEWRNFFGRADVYRKLGQAEKAEADDERATRLQQRR